jgi:putative tryptophan/tyrosine transport system substrate-binding protein
VAKQFEALHEMVPTATVIGCLLNPNNPKTELDAREAQEAARALGLELQILHAGNETEIERAFATLAQRRAGGLVVVPDGFFNSRHERLATRAAHHMIPAISSHHEFAMAGGLMSYGSSTKNEWRQVGVYTGRILKGEKPADLPVIQSTKVELYINLKAARALGLTFPLTLLGRADVVIE